MRFLVMTDIEGVTGVTSFPQAESSPFGKEMLMHDLMAVLDGIKEAGADAVVYDMHTDGRNVDVTRLSVPVVMGKPILPDLYRGVGDALDGLFLLGLHTMQHTGDLLCHSYLREYDEIRLNGRVVGEIGVEAALAGERGIPLVFVSGDDKGCEEAKSLVPSVVTCPVKYSLGEDAALCPPPEETALRLKEAARLAATAAIAPLRPEAPYTVEIDFSDCPYLRTMRALHPELFVSERTLRMTGDALLPLWSQVLLYEREMIERT